jgi:hypothetical protein
MPSTTSLESNRKRLFLHRQVGGIARPLPTNQHLTLEGKIKAGRIFRDTPPSLKPESGGVARDVVAVDWSDCTAECRSRTQYDQRWIRRSCTVRRHLGNLEVHLRRAGD